MDLKKYINQISGIEISDNSINIISDCQKQNEKLKAYAIIGDKLADFLDCLNNDKDGLSPISMDNFRQKYSSDEFWVECFNFWNFENLIKWNTSNGLGKKIKSTFVEALLFCFFEETNDLEQTYEAIKKIRAININ